MNRREALRNAAAVFGLPLAAAAGATSALPEAALYNRDPEAYWARIREEQFLLPKWRAYLNAGSLGVAPRSVVNAVSEYLARGAGRVTDEYPRWGYETMDQHRGILADYIGCKKD